MKLVFKFSDSLQSVDFQNAAKAVITDNLEASFVRHDVIDFEREGLLFNLVIATKGLMPKNTNTTVIAEYCSTNGTDLVYHWIEYTGKGDNQKFQLCFMKGTKKVIFSKLKVSEVTEATINNILEKVSGDNECLKINNIPAIAVCQHKLKSLLPNGTVSEIEKYTELYTKLLKIQVRYEHGHAWKPSVALNGPMLWNDRNLHSDNPEVGALFDKLNTVCAELVKWDD